MVCLACLLPLFLVPIVNVLPLLFDFIMAKMYRLFGKEYQKPERTAPACPYKPATGKPNNSVSEEPKLVGQDSTHKSAGKENSKCE